MVDVFCVCTLVPVSLKLKRAASFLFLVVFDVRASDVNGGIKSKDKTREAILKTLVTKINCEKTK